MTTAVNYIEFDTIKNFQSIPKRFIAKIINEATKDLKEVLTKSVMEQIKKEGLISD